ncbi:MAG: undecaprenyl-phosphate glucose phosphotransferase [Sphaerotilus natans subsp. sulfidivorans]|uniref:undecaprenyl-phosphate glucose phosphotransferase n=1 Tax=Sphaerotilus sulfidivorans TaxID=639200 RepID=UPI0023570AE0|nr:undecaprenyl-phosphate glucose phosphotransferase [Sphaerotilus sulfidivorans]MCK6402724.1 undecaprenyl-phosphate glucose phosphotransferase [Sphaerotilus sulfidivorans]
MSAEVPAQHPPSAFKINRPGGAPMDALPFSPPPPSIPVFMAAVLEPILAVATFLAVHFAHGHVLDRASMLLSILVMLLVFPGTNRFYENRLNALVDLCAAWATVMTILVLCGFATKSFKFFDSSVLMWWAVLTPAVQFAAVLVGGAVMRRHALRPEARRSALVIGAGPLGAKVGNMLLHRKSFGHDFIGHLEDRDASRCDPSTREHIVGRIDEAVECIRRHNIKDVYITLPLSSQPRIERMIAALHDSAVSIYFVPDVFGVNVIQGRMRNMDGLPVVSLLESPFVGINGLIKRLSDIVLASIILVLIAPLLIGVAIGVRISSPGPIIFKQKRGGLDGEDITVYKFRSMRVMENGAKVTQATRGDPRITRFGAFIRRTSLDELPQFINVLQGRMSIVGPRPHAVAHNEEYRELVKAYMLRHKVKPGITGWAQVNGLRGETETVEKMAERVRYDIEYLRNWSLTMDLRIIARTIKLTVADSNAY